MSRACDVCAKQYRVRLLLAVPLALMWRMLESPTKHEASPGDLAVGGMARPQAELPRGAATDTDERSTTARPLSRNYEDSDGTRPLQEDRSLNQAETQAPPGPPVMGIAPEVASLDDSVVGQSFPVSESIIATCKKSPWRSGCEPGMPLLAKFTEEPREEPWASSAEQAIHALVEREPQTNTPRSTTFTIRNLECRASICFVETASHMEGFHPRLFYFERENRLKAGYSIFSSETKVDGTDVYVTLLPVVRTALSTRELTERAHRQ